MQGVSQADCFLGLSPQSEQGDADFARLTKKDGAAWRGGPVLLYTYLLILQ